MESSLGGHERLRAHQNWAWEPKSGSQTALKTTSLFDYWQLCNGNGPSNRWTCVTERRVLRWKTNLSGSSCLLLPFLSVSFFLQPLPLLLLCDGQFPDFFRTGRTETLASFLQVHVATRFISSRLSRADKSTLSGGMAAHPSLCWLHYLRGEINNRRRGTGFLKRQLH